MSLSGVADQYANPTGVVMQDTKITVAALRSVLRKYTNNSPDSLLSSAGTDPRPQLGRGHSGGGAGSAVGVSAL